MISLRLVLKLSLLLTLAVLLPSSEGFPQKQVHHVQGRSLCADLSKGECTAITVCNWDKKKKDCAPVIDQFADDGTGKDQNDDEDQDDDEEQNDEKRKPPPKRPQEQEEEEEDDDDEEEEEERRR